MDVTPVNYQQRDSSPEAIARDVDYALQVADSYAGSLPDGVETLAGGRLLELGPGPSLGTAVVLACHGAAVTVADRYLAPWDPVYHPAFLAALAARLAAERPAVNVRPIHELLATGAFDTDGLRCLHLGTEDLLSVPDESFDVVLSNAVFEHIEDVPAALGNLARITRRGGCGVHQVDFRDHRDFDRPLEFLILSRDAFAHEFAFRKGECGNRWRHGVLGAAMRQAGFRVLSFTANLFADAAYVADLRTRLHRDFAALDGQELGVLSGCFVLRRPAGSRAGSRAGTPPGTPPGTRSGARPGAQAEAELDTPGSIARSGARYAFARPFAAGRSVLDVGCGNGLGCRLLLPVGPQSLTGLDDRREALDLARLLDPESRADRYLHWEPGAPLPAADGSCGLLLCLDLFERLDDPAARAQLVREARRVLAPDGVALIAAPHGGPADDFETFVTLLADFEWVEFFGLADLRCAVVLPLEGGAVVSTQGTLTAPATASLGDDATTGVLALCRLSRPLVAPRVPPVGFAVPPGDGSASP